MSWIDSYVEYARNNEASERFHWWTGATILGATLRRNVQFSKGYYSVFPNLWTLIVSPSGTKKTTAVTIGYNILSKLDHVRIFSSKMTPEVLARALGTPEEEGGQVIESQGVIYAPEFANFLDKKHYNEGLVQLLLRLADCPEKEVWETVGGGKLPWRNVAIVILGAIADDMVSDCIPPLALKSGFLARFIVIPGEPKKEAFPFPWKDAKLEQEVLTNLYEISLLRGEMVLTQKASEWYVEWYYKHKAQMATEVGSKFRAYYERKPDHLLRLGMITAIAKNRRLEYTPEAFQEALDHLEDLEDGLGKLYTAIGASTLGKDQLMILEQIRRAGTLSHAEIIRKNHALLEDPNSFKKILAVLVEAEYVKVVRDRKQPDQIYYQIKGKGK